MKILDRYVLTLFLKNYLISFMVLVGLYVVLDMVFQFDEFAELAEQSRRHGGGVRSVLELGWAVGSFYFHQMFLFFAHLSGIIPVVAAGFTLIRLGRFNELVAMLAAGVPLVRIAMPIIIAALVLNVLLLVDQELLIPNMIPQLVRKHDQVMLSHGPSFPVQALQDENNAILMAGRFTPGDGLRPATMEQVDVIERNEKRQPTAHIVADAAEWDKTHQRWRLINGEKVTDLLDDARRSPPFPVEFYASNLTPEEITLYRSGDYVELLSTERINQLLQRPTHYGTANLLRVKHARFTQPIVNIILLLLAIAPLLAVSSDGLVRRMMLCAGLSAACMGAIFLTQNLAGSPPDAEWSDRWAAVMAWAPILVFGPIAIWLLERANEAGGGARTRTRPAGPLADQPHPLSATGKN